MKCLWAGGKGANLWMWMYKDLCSSVNVGHGPWTTEFRHFVYQVVCVLTLCQNAEWDTKKNQSKVFQKSVLLVYYRYKLENPTEEKNVCNQEWQNLNYTGQPGAHLYRQLKQILIALKQIIKWQGEYVWVCVFPYRKTLSDYQNHQSMTKAIGSECKIAPSHYCVCTSFECVKMWVKECNVYRYRQNGALVDYFQYSVNKDYIFILISNFLSHNAHPMIKSMLLLLHC